MADRDKLLEDILGVLPDMSPPWLKYQIALHLAIDPNPSNTQMRIIDAAFAYGYVKAAEQPLPLGIPPIPQFPVALPPPVHAAPAPPGTQAREKRKASEPVDFPDAKKRAGSKTVDFTQIIRPFVQGRDFKYQELSLSYLNAELANLPMNYIRRQFHRFQYLTPAYLAMRQELAAGSLTGVSLKKKRRFTTGPYGAECEASPLFVAEKRALDAYIASGCRDMKLLREAAPPQGIDPARPRTPVRPSSRSSSGPSTPIAGPSQSSVPNSTQSSYASVGSSVKRWGLPGRVNRAANQAHESRSPSPLARRHGSRSPTPIEIETQGTEASVVVIESQDSVVVIESQQDELQLPRSPSPAPQPSKLECGCCFAEYDFSDMMQCSDGHLFCPDCTRKNAETAIGDSKPAILCMDQIGCRAPFPDEQLRRVLSPETLDLVYRLQTLDLVYRLRQKKEIDDAKILGLEHCPFCDYAYIITDTGPTARREIVRRNRNVLSPETLDLVYRLRQKKEIDDAKILGLEHCPFCDYAYIITDTGPTFHGGKSCEEIAQQEKSSRGEHAIAEAMTMALIRDCPDCQTPFMKESGCNKMNCPKCGTVSCYICRQRVPKISPYTHFDRDPDAYHLPPDRRKCPLWDIDRTGRAGGSPTRLHNEAVAQAEREARARHALPKLNAPRF
ncbi:hypothetical protein RSAG8_00437, partial [Rhizoctonia solani AG-8 WAC10335]